jgi:hypothetical protein
MQYLRRKLLSSRNTPTGSLNDISYALRSRLALTLHEGTETVESRNVQLPTALDLELAAVVREQSDTNLHVPNTHSYNLQSRTKTS